ncbi:septal ring lytic transglycosylase RlpA family protein [Aurantimonas sp. HBX-1]|uniref:septal ring lytic transglycosylase RlpA family protein n=1 Tax=Aurantimonas sp. HBX-1 TaxID=2906072 RepID=UPI001F31ACDD|nr:septal ring lytic transglycosylase RlpA family protein [Aurantimonas sp. HBX-1]UIJ73690.1 septal ring lytic transglycosylase RlpA family protein [Aurantimonas sp. HBX-1]
MAIVAAEYGRRMTALGMVLAVGLVLPACQGSGAGSPVDELAEIGTAVKFDSQTFGVPASPRVTNLKRVPKGGGRSHVGKPYKVRGEWYYPKDEPGYVGEGQASWYGPNFHGRLTANGEIYDMHGLSAAHKTFPLPSYAMVTNKKTGSRVMVRVNDRGPFSHGREIDVSSQAAELLGFKHAGVADVTVEYVGRAPLEGDDTKMLMASYQPGENVGEAPVMVAEGQGASREGGPLMAFAGAIGLPGVRPLDRAAEGGSRAGGIDLGRLLGAARIPAFSASYAGATVQGGALAAVQQAAAGPQAAGGERIQIGVIDPALMERVRSVTLGEGALETETAPGTGQISASLSVDGDASTDAVLRRLWQVGAADAFVIRD